MGKIINKLFYKLIPGRGFAYRSKAYKIMIKKGICKPVGAIKGTKKAKLYQNSPIKGQM
jgi:hypothetical protein